MLVEQKDNMFLREFDDPNLVKFTTIVKQLESDIDNGEIDVNNYSTDQLLSHLEDNDIILDVTDLYDMIKNPPLNTVIKNIQGDKVIFKGHDDTQISPDQTQSQQVVQQMAQSAMPTK